MSIGQGHNRDLQGLKGLADAAKAVVEGKTDVYELVGSLSDEQVQEVLEASLEAKEEGYEEFEYEGRTYSVNVGESLSKHLAEKELVGKQKELDVDGDGDIGADDLAALRAKKKSEAVSRKDFKPHMMYDPKTGKGVMANTFDDHLRLDKMGYVHDKPKKMAEDEKPDFLDLDKGGDKEEPMKKAAADKEEDEEQLDEYGAAGNLRADKDSLDGKKAVDMSPDNNPLDDEDIEKKDGEEEESEDPKEMKSEGFTEEEVRALCHSKDHDCATIIEHPEFGLGKPVHGSHAIPDDNGFVEWYDVEFKHGIEKKVYVEGVKVIASESHMKEDEEDGIDGAKPIDKDVKKNVTTSKASEPKGGDSKVTGTDDEEDGIEGSKPISKDVKENNYESFPKSFVEIYKEMMRESIVFKKITEAIELKEGKMKELHGHIEDGKTAEEIIKAMKLKKTPDMIKFIKGLGGK